MMIRHYQGKYYGGGKEAFSDGVSKQTRSWYEIVQDFVDDIIQSNENEHNDFSNKHNSPKTKEQLYYRIIFNKNYEECSELIPYF